MENYKANIVSEDFAKQLASHLDPDKYSNSQKKENLKTNQKKGIRPLGNTYTIKDKKQYPALYVISYTNDSGFAITSAEKDYNPICAYIPNGSIKKDSLPIGLAKWFSTTLQHIEFVRTGKYDNKKNAAANWKHVLDENELGISYNNFKVAPDDPIDPPVEPDCNSPYYTTQKGPFITTTWGQGCNYNNAINFNCTVNCGRPPTGCVATAMAQIIRYWQPQNSFNYDYSATGMPNAAAFNSTEIQRLMADVGNQVGISYGCIASSGQNSNIPAAIATFGIGSADHWNYNYLDVKSDLNQSHPVILGGFSDGTWYTELLPGIWEIGFGNGHTWICDGYIQSSNQCYGFLNFHMNWG